MMQNDLRTLKWRFGFNASNVLEKKNNAISYDTRTK